MKKINFEDGTLVSNAKVTIDNVEHEVTPAEYSGNTPLSAYTLNLMQSNIEEQLKTTQTTDIAEAITITDCAGVNGSLDIKDGKTIQEGTPTSDTPIDIRNVGDNINLFDNIITTQTLNGITFTKYEDGTLVLNGTSTVEFYPSLSNVFRLQNKTYTLSTSENMSNTTIKITIRKNSVNENIITLLSDKSITFNNVSNSDLFAYLCIRANQQFNNYTIKAKLEEGSVATPYTPYNCGSIDIKVKNEDNTQNKIIQFPLVEGQVLHEGDYLAEDGIHQVRKTVVFDGTENWGYSSAKLRFYLTLNDITLESAFDSSAKTIVISNHLKATIFYYIYTDLTLDNVISGHDSTKSIHIRAKQFTTVEQLKTYLAEQYANGTPLKIEYELETEVVTQYTEEQEQAYYELQHLLMYEDYTNIECIDEIKPDIQVTYLYNNEINKSFSSRIDKLEDEVYELKKQVSDLIAMVLSN